MTLSGSDTYTGGLTVYGGTLVQNGTSDSAPDSADASAAAPSTLADGSLVLPFAPLGLQYASDSSPHPIISADVPLQLSRGTATLTSVQTSLNFGGIQAPTQYYNPAGAVATHLYRFSTQVNATSLPTGHYTWVLTVTQYYSDSSYSVSTYSGAKDIGNWSQGPFGPGWQLASLEWLVPNAQGVSLVSGDGTMTFFTSNASGGYQSEPGAFAYSTLSGNWTSGFTLTGRDGELDTFNASGELVSVTDHDGNLASFSYNANGTIASITDPSHHTTTFGYTGNLVTQVTDFAGRVTTLAYNSSGQLTSITQPNPGSGSPVTQFGYDPTTGLLDSITDADQNQTTFSYDFAHTLHTITQPDQTTLTFQCVEVASLPQTATQSNPAAIVDLGGVHASAWDESNHLTEYTLDPFGLPTSVLDAENNLTTYSRNVNGQVTQLVEPNPGNGLPTTTYQYNANGELNGETLPDGSTELWTYQTINTAGGPFDQVLSDTYSTSLPAVLEESDSPGSAPPRITDYTLDPNTGDILDVNQNGLITAYTYTQHSSNPSNPPGGLAETMTDPNGNQTDYQFNSEGLLTQTTSAVGTSVQASTEEAYDSADDLVTSTNALGYQTTYIYDVLGRMTSMTQPPDSNGVHPVTSYQYDAMGNMTQQTDPLGRVTSWTYNNMGELTQTTTPGPDDSPTPNVTTMTYTPTGLLATETNPAGGVTSYAYGALGEELSVTGPAPDPVNYPNVRPVTSYTYDPLMRVISETDPMGNVTTTSYTYTSPFGDGTVPSYTTWSEIS